jgi:hypothetical protein
VVLDSNNDSFKCKALFFPTMSKSLVQTFFSLPFNVSRRSLLRDLTFCIYQEVKRKKYLYYLKLKRVQEKKKRGVPIDDPGDLDSDMMQVEE